MKRFMAMNEEKKEKRKMKEKVQGTLTGRE